MAAYPVGALLEVSTFCTTFAQNGINVRHWEVTAVAGLGLEPPVLAGELSTALAALYKPCLSTSANYAGLRMRRVQLVPEAPVVSVAGAGNGTGGASTLPNQVAGVVSLRTFFAGRSFRGRLYCPFPSEDSSDAQGRPTPGYLVALAALGQYFVGPKVFALGPDAMTLTPIIYSKVLNARSTILSRVTRPNFGTQRRRSSINRPDALGPGA